MEAWVFLSFAHRVVLKMLSLAMHVLDEIFCSASLILPDKAGRILNIGGWSDSALYGVRLLTPDGSPGVPSHNDWQEDLNNAVLQVCAHRALLDLR
jgi:hypothetical protein